MTNTANSLGFTPYQCTSGEEYMNEKQLAHIESILIAWQKSLINEAGKTIAHMQDELTSFPDPLDNAMLEEEFSLELKTRDRERKLSKKIEDALQRLRSLDFGYCESCGIEIGLSRLEARPTATLCIDCKTLAETQEKHHLGG